MQIKPALMPFLYELAKRVRILFNGRCDGRQFIFFEMICVKIRLRKLFCHSGERLSQSGFQLKCCRFCEGDHQNRADWYFVLN